MANHVRRRSRRIPALAFVMIGVVGLVIGLAYAWFINPVDYVDVEPSQLGSDQQRTYLILISLAFANDGNLERAQQRLRALGLEDDPGSVLAEAADEAVALGVAERSINALANLSLVLGGEPRVANVLAGTRARPSTVVPSPTAAETAIPTSTPTPETSPTSTQTTTPQVTSSPESETATPTPQGPPFAVAEFTAFCNPDRTPGLLTVLVQDEAGDGLPGVEVVVSWTGGQDSFFTGLKPEQGAGYADFVMAEGRLYTVQLVDGGQAISVRSDDIQPAICTPGGDADPQLEGVRLVFSQN